MTSLGADTAALSVTPDEKKLESVTQVNALGYPFLQPIVPIPSDITISQHIVRTVGLLPIQDVAKQ
jgi:hypothetical protein